MVGAGRRRFLGPERRGEEAAVAAVSPPPLAPYTQACGLAVRVSPRGCGCLHRDVNVEGRAAPGPGATLVTILRGPQARHLPPSRRRAAGTWPVKPNLS